MRDVCISKGIYYMGVNDRRKHLFENNWPLPYGVSYNSYLIKDEKSVLIDTIEYGSNDNYLNHIERILNGAPLDYLVVNHMEPDIRLHMVYNQIIKWCSIKNALYVI